MINDDAEITLDLVGAGYRVIYEKAARSFESASIHINDDFHVKVRMVAGGFQTIERHWRTLLAPNWFNFTFFSHKILRWLVPEFMVVTLIGSFLLMDNPFFALLFYGQLAFYGISYYGWKKISQQELPSYIYVPFYFTAMNLAALFGLRKYLAGQQSVNWRKAER